MTLLSDADADAGDEGWLDDEFNGLCCREKEISLDMIPMFRLSWVQRCIIGEHRTAVGLSRRTQTIREKRSIVKAKHFSPATLCDEEESPVHTHPRHPMILDVVLPLAGGLSLATDRLSAGRRAARQSGLPGPRRAGLVPAAVVLLICSALAAFAPCRSIAEEAQKCPYAKPADPAGLDVSGSVDVYLSHNFASPSDRTNLYRAFDGTEGSFQLSLAEIVLQEKGNDVGFRMDLGFGPTTDLIHTSLDNSSGAPVSVVDETYKHIQQAYVSFRIPVALGKDVWGDVGKFLTHIGAEAVETKDNHNYSRSLLFTWAEPCLHAGARLSYPAGDRVTLNGYVYNGWNRVVDNNSAFSYGAQIQASPSPELSFVQNWIGGPEKAGDTDDWRHLLNSIVTFNPTPRTSVTVNYEYGWEKDAVFGGSTGDMVRAGDIVWQGIAGYVHHSLDERIALSPRVEWFKDRDGFMTGTPQRLAEVTLTFEITRAGGLSIRPEWRTDWSDKPVFKDRNRGDVTSQSTLMVGLVQSF